MIKAKMMKLISTAIVFALLLGNGVAVPATAAGEVTVTINAPASALAGSNFTASVDIGSVTNFDAANYDVSFNPSVLRLNNVTAGSIGGSVIPVDVWNEASPGIATIIQNVPGLTGVNGTGSLSMLHFTAIGLPGQTSNITLSNGILGNTLAQQIPAIWVGDSVNVTGVTKTLTSIIVTPANQSIPLGLLQQFTATGVYSDNSTANLTSTATWTSSNTGVATINSAGQAASLAQGTTNITAASGNISGSTTLTVTAPVLLSLAVTPVNPSNTLGQTRQFSATGTYTNGSGNITANVTWSSSNVAVATINSSGLASSVAIGTTVISATLGSISGNTTLTVTSPPLVSIAVTPANPSISRSQKQQFTATGTYSNASTANITGTAAWTSSNTSVATINNAGLASSVGAGSTIITATSGDLTGNTILTVTQITTVEVNSGSTITLNAGGSINATSSSGIAVAVKGLPNMGAPANGLAGFRFDFSWNKNVVNVNSAFKNNAAGWDTILPGTPNNTTGTLTSTGFTTTYSTSDIVLVYLGVTAVGSLGDNTTITVAITSLGDKDGTPITALAVNAPVIIGSPLMAETSIATGLSLTTTDVVVVKTNVNRIKNQSDNLTAIIPGGIGSYSATAGGSPGSALQFLTVNGVSPFNSPVFNSGTGVFSVGSVSSPIQPNNTTLAEVVTILTGDANTSVSLSVAYQTIGAAGQPGLNVPEEHSNALTFRRGDVKEDVNVDIFDALFIAQYIVGQRPLSGINPLNAASVKHDGTGGDKIDIFDALFIAQYIVGQKNAFYQ